MTRIQRILSALATGPKSAREISALTGMPIDVITRAMSDMRTRCGVVECTPVMYQITDAGHEKLLEKRKTPPQYLAQKAAVRARRKSERMVDMAMRSQPNSVFAMGGLNA